MKWLVLLLALANAGLFYWQFHLTPPPAQTSSVTEVFPAQGKRLLLLSEAPPEPPVVVAQAEAVAITPQTPRAMIFPATPDIALPPPVTGATVVDTAEVPTEPEPAKKISAVAGGIVSSLKNMAGYLKPEPTPTGEPGTSATLPAPTLPAATAEVTAPATPPLTMVAEAAPPIAPEAVAPPQPAPSPPVLAAGTEAASPAATPETTVAPETATAVVAEVEIKPATMQETATLQQKLAARAAMALAKPVPAAVPAAPETAPKQAKAMPTAPQELGAKPLAQAEAVKPAKAPPNAGMACWRGGPYRDAKIAQQATQKLRERGLPVALKERQQRGEHVRSWVYMPPQPSWEAAHALEWRLDQAGVYDHSLVNKPGMKNAISLGVFRDEEGAKRRVAEVRARGFAQAQIQSQYSHSTAFWVEMAMPQDEAAKLAKAVKTSELDKVACEEIAISAEIP